MIHLMRNGRAVCGATVTSGVAVIHRVTCEACGEWYRTSPVDVPPARRDDRDRILKAVKFMEQHGGGFCAALAKCWFKADSTNQLLLEGTFRHYFERFQRDVDELERRKVAGEATK